MANGLKRRAPVKTWIENRELARILLDSMAEAIYAIDMLGNCTFCNAA
jgi:PAS domain-containing protein